MPHYYDAGVDTCDIIALICNMQLLFNGHRKSTTLAGYRELLLRRAQKVNNNCNDKHFWGGVRICRGLHTGKTAYECTQGLPNETIGSYSIVFALQLIYIWVHQKLLLHYTICTADNSLQLILDRGRGSPEWVIFRKENENCYTNVLPSPTNQRLTDGWTTRDERYGQAGQSLSRRGLWVHGL